MQHFAYRESSLRRKGAAKHKIYTVWQYQSLFPLGGGGGGVGNFLAQMISSCLRGTYRKGGGSASCDLDLKEW